MARPTKQGIDYFPIDVEFDDKIEMYILEKEGVGLAVLVSIWQIIYKNEGYYTKSGDDLLLLVKKRINVDINEVSECVNVCLRRDIFDKSLHKKHGILTSRAIQKRYFDAAKKKKQVKVLSDYLLIDVSVYENLVNVDDNSIDSGGNATNVKEDVDVKEEVKERYNNERERSELSFDVTSEITDEAQKLMLQTFGRNPKIPEMDIINKHLEKFGFEKTKNIYKSAVLSNFNSLKTLDEKLNEDGSIKPRDNNNGQKTTYTSKGQLDSDNFAKILRTDFDS